MTNAAERVCGQGVRFAIVPAWVAELSKEQLSDAAFRLYVLWCGSTNAKNGEVWARNGARSFALECLGKDDRSLRNWQNELEALGFISKLGKFGIIVHRRLDDVEETQRQNAVPNRRHSQAAGKPR